jgi:hypothetical protein
MRKRDRDRHHLADVIRRMSQGGEILVLCLSEEGGEFWLEPSQTEVLGAVAAALMTIPEIKSQADGLFNGAPSQTWVWRQRGGELEGDRNIQVRQA